MFTTIEEFLIHWGHEGGSTQKILDGLTDESLAQEVSPEDRTLGRIAWHIVQTLHEMMSQTGLNFTGTPGDAPVPETAAGIADAYRSSNEAMVSAIKTQWTDEVLGEMKDMYGRAMVGRNGTRNFNGPPNPSPRTNDSAHASSGFTCTRCLRTSSGRMGGVWRTSTCCLNGKMVKS